ncbi:LLM class flavin-dependent oxidoreductase [Flavobacterium pectinovorum]|uniref:LLM class flavin-dependent oxidoreductase n=1 Tax=Flavobacterium pectinovorum TaxID=29533 RepID=UPI00265FC279|nr:LLM class flavin-dependent oxidoreductase [Flavobacterium pectinovorum]WKL48931.1 LLM class flavin-dependent oxidoreductase [Flavobacterium pectinovorum]
MINLSILDYSPIDENSNSREALLATTALAQLADELNFKRFWVSEHHGMQTLAGSNPEMLMMHLAAHTKNIRIGSGGVMLQHYSAYKVAEGIKLMEALYPGRIDLGIGRAPGGDKITHSALNIGKKSAVTYEQQLRDLQSYLTGIDDPRSLFPGLIPTPIIDTLPQLWSLGAGSSGGSIAANEGTSYIFAHFINPSGAGIQSTEDYLHNFRASAITPAAQNMVAVFLAIAPTSKGAELLAKGFDHWLLMIESGRETPYYISPDHTKNHNYTLHEQQIIKHNRNRIIVGNPEEVKLQIEKLAEKYHTNEVMLLPNIFGKENRLKSLELLAEVFRS